MSFIGTADAGGLEFEETSIIEQRRPEAGLWCIKTGSLVYEAESTTLAGHWSAPGCSPGRATLKRVDGSRARGGAAAGVPQMRDLPSARP